MRRFNQIQGTSAAKALLDYLSNKNTTIQDMFILLHKVELYRGMDILREYVPEKLHSLIKSGPLLACKPSIQSVPQYTSVQQVEPKIMPVINIEETRSQNIVSNNTTPYLQNLHQHQQGNLHKQGSEFPTQSTMYISEFERARQNYDPERVRQMSQMERVRHLSDIERARHLSETTAGTSVTGSSVTSGGVLVVRYEEIAAACDNWNKNLKLGEGGFGQVFKGVWKHQEVAIKTIKKDKYLVNEDIEHKNKSIHQCFQEISFLNRLRSEFIVPIIAHSEANFNGKLEPCIVYQ